MTTGFSINSAGSGQAEEKAPAAERMTGSQAIIRTLELLGVTDVFGRRATNPNPKMLN